MKRFTKLTNIKMERKIKNIDFINVECPYCNSTNLDLEMTYAEDNALTINAKCNDCNKDFNIGYRAVEIFKDGHIYNSIFKQTN